MASWMKKYDSAKRQITKARNAAEATVFHVRRDAEAIGSAAAFGAVRGHYEGAGKNYYIGKTAKISPELALAVPMKLLAYTGVGGSASDDLHAISIGPLAYLAGMRAREHMIEKAKEDKTKKSGDTTGASHGNPALLAARQNAIRAELRRRATATA